MYIFYLLGFKKPDDFKLEQFKKKERKQLLTSNGLFNIGEKNIFREKISIEDSDEITHYIKNYTLAFNNVIKRNEKVYQIPHNHVISHRIEYNINDVLTFVITQCNNFSDYFFETKEDLNNFELKKDLFTFLSKVK